MIDSTVANAAMQKSQIKRNISASGSYSSLVRYLSLVLDEERAIFEGTDATEYQRGRVNAVRDILRDLPNTGHR